MASLFLDSFTELYAFLDCCLMWLRTYFSWEGDF